MGVSSGDFIFAGLERLPEPGKEMVCKDFIIKPGGAVNTPAALSRLGAGVAFVTALGTDYAGGIVYDFLKDNGFNMNPVIFRDDLRTSVSAVLSTPEDRAFATYFARSDIGSLESKIVEFAGKSRYIHSFMIDCLELPVISVAESNNLPFSVDTHWHEYIRLRDIKEMLCKCDVFFTNEIEACTLTGKSGYEAAADELAKHARLVVVKLGAKGCMVIRGGSALTMPAFDVGEIKDKTGCGDLFVAGFLYGYAVCGWQPEKSAALGLTTGALAATFYGGVDDTFTREHVFELFKTFYPAYV